MLNHSFELSKSKLEDWEGGGGGGNVIMNQQSLLVNAVARSNSNSNLRASSIPYSTRKYTASTQIFF